MGRPKGSKNKPKELPTEIVLKKPAETILDEKAKRTVVANTILPMMEIAAKAAYDDLITFAPLVSSTESGKKIEAPPGSFHNELARNLMAIEAGKFTRLLLNVPPRHGKSRWSSIIYPAWYLGRNPNHRVLLVSNSNDNAIKFSEACREIIQSEAYKTVFKGIVLGDSKRKDSWTLQRSAVGMADNSFVALGTYSSVLGRGADLIILDDVVDAENTATDAQRKKLSRWIRQSVMSRLAPNGKVLCIGHRFHVEDLYSEFEADGWPSIKHPAIDEFGNALWPEEWPVTRLREIEGNSPMSKAIFQATYQGDPTEMSEGSLISRENVKIVEGLGFADGADVGIAIDCAMSQKDSSDYFVAVAGYRGKGGELIVPTMVRGKFSFTEQIDIIKKLIERYHPYVVGIEKAAGGLQLIEMLKQKGVTAWIKGIDAISDKSSRAAQLITLFGENKVLLGEDFEEVVNEIVSFPQGRHDDCVDALAHLTHLPLTSVGETESTVVDYAPRGYVGLPYRPADPYRNITGAETIGDLLNASRMVIQ